VLDDFVFSTLGTTALDECVAITLKTESVLANLNPPDILNGARALAVDTLSLICNLVSVKISKLIVPKYGARYYCLCFRKEVSCLRTGTNDDILQSGPILEEKDGISIATFVLTSALDAAPIGLHPTIECTRH